jgi:hypothetical protein
MSSPTILDVASRTGGRMAKPKGWLSASDRNRLPSSDFALPGRGEGPKGKGSGSYPIPNASHARNALARVAQHGTPEEKSDVRAAVHRKFPGIGGDAKERRKALYSHPRSAAHED